MKNVLVWRNITSRIKHITQDVWPSKCCVLGYMALGRKSLETPALVSQTIIVVLLDLLFKATKTNTCLCVDNRLTPYILFANVDYNEFIYRIAMCLH